MHVDEPFVAEFRNWTAMSQLQDTPFTSLYRAFPEGRPFNVVRQCLTVRAAG
jgi:hypothetical protein